MFCARKAEKQEIALLDDVGDGSSDLGALAAQLQDEGSTSFVKSWNELMAVIASKSTILEKAG